jgi:hypothetical protein
MASLRGGRIMAIVGLCLGMTAAPVDAQQVSQVVAVCTGGVQLTFTPALPLVPTTATLSVGISSVGSLNCLDGSTASFLATLTTLPLASCTGPLVGSGIGTGTLIGGFGMQDMMDIVLAGTPAAPVWVMTPPTGAVVVSAGAGVWLDQSEIGTCALMGKTSTVTLTATIVIAAG